MELISRYTAPIYAIGAEIAVIGMCILFGFSWLAIQMGHEVAPVTWLSLYVAVLDALFYVFGFIAALVSSFVLLAMLVQLAVLDIHENYDFKIDKQKRAFWRGVMMIAANVFIFAGVWSATYSGKNLSLGSSIFSEFFLAPLFVALLFIASGFLFLFSPLVRSTT